MRLIPIIEALDFDFFKTLISLDRFLLFINYHLIMISYVSYAYHIQIKMQYTVIPYTNNVHENADYDYFFFIIFIFVEWLL